MFHKIISVITVTVGNCFTFTGFTLLLLKLLGDPAASDSQYFACFLMMAMGCLCLFASGMWKEWLKQYGL